MDQAVVEALFSAFIVVAVMLLVGFPVHEFMHAWTAMRLGDDTARWMGRVSLDPRVHFDQMGGLILAGTAVLQALGVFSILFGYAKPTPVNPVNLRNGRQGHALVAFAGPASNLVVAALTAIAIRILRLDPDWWNYFVDTPVLLMLLRAGLLLLTLNILLFVFNLIPVPPLDGWSVLKGIVPAATARRLDELEIQYANVIPTLFFGLILVIFLTGGAFLFPIIDGIRDLLLGI
jgi:Zn-dependent protease